MDTQRMIAMAATMLPYWILGAFIIWATANSKWKDLVRVEGKPILSFLKFLGILTLYRIFMFKMFPNLEVLKQAATNISLIPWPMTLTVFWEDAAHGLPLVLLQRFIGTKKWTWPIHGLVTVMMMLEFGMGHVYQGLLAAIMLSFYVPYSTRLGKKYGFGTVMVCHVLFDLVTILTMKIMLGA